MKITVMTPTLTPRIVSDERSLLARNVETAIFADSLMSSKAINSGQWSVVSKSFWLLTGY